MCQRMDLDSASLLSKIEQRVKTIKDTNMWKYFYNLGFVTFVVTIK